MSTVLDKIVAQTRIDVAARAAALPLATLEATLAPSLRSFADALRSDRVGVRLLAEFKPRSPARGVLREGAQIADVVPVYARYAAGISVLCDAPFFGGGYGMLREARALVDTPLLAKDFVVGRYQIAEARAAGADAVLLIAALLDDPTMTELLAYARDLGMEPLLETHDDDEQARALDAGALVVGVNSRDLRTMAIDLRAMRRRLAMVPRDRVVVAESGTETAADIDALCGVADAALIGSALMTAADIGGAIEALGFSPVGATP